MGRSWRSEGTRRCSTSSRASGHWWSSSSLRVWFEPAVLEGQATPEPHGPCILSSPKPSYFPNYVDQPDAGRDWTLPQNGQYATYIRTSKSPRPRVRGWKRYPARPGNQVAVPSLEAEQKTNKKIQTVLYPLPGGVRFTGRVVFHNLKPEEMGALLWSLRPEGSGDFHHGLGMGKPFGFGQVVMEFTGTDVKIEPNDPSAHADSISDSIEKFKGWMTANLGEDWAGTPQIEALLAMGHAHGEGFPQHDYRYPKLTMSMNEFQKAKQEGAVLASFIEHGRLEKARKTPRRQPQDHPVERDRKRWEEVPLTWKKGSQILESRLSGPGSSAASLEGEPARELMRRLPEAARKRLDKGKPVTVDLDVEHAGGNRWKILVIHPRG